MIPNARPPSAPAGILARAKLPDRRMRTAGSRVPAGRRILHLTRGTHVAPSVFAFGWTNDPPVARIRRLQGEARPDGPEIDWNDFCDFTIKVPWVKVVLKSEAHLKALLSNLPEAASIEIWPTIAALCADLDNRMQVFQRYIEERYGS